MNRLIRYLLFILFAFLSFYYAWSEGGRRISDREYNKVSANTPPLITKSIGYDTNVGNVVAVQALMHVLDYSTQERFSDKIESYIIEAKKKGFVKEGTIFLFPEHIGTPLVLLGEKKEMYAANSINSAFYQIAIGNLISYFRTSFAAKNQGNKGEIIFKMKSAEMKSVYEKTFLRLSAFYGVKIIAGSILLPEPEVSPKMNEIKIKEGNFLNASFLFLPDGKIHPKFTVKHNLASTERQIAVSLNAENAFLNYNNLEILLSNDTLYNSVYGEKSKTSEILLSPSILFEKDEIDWTNKDIYGEKELFDANLKKADLWKRYGIFEKTKASQTTRIVIQVFLIVKFFDLSLEGESSGLIRYVNTETLNNKNPAILNVWF